MCTANLSNLLLYFSMLRHCSVCLYLFLCIVLPSLFLQKHKTQFFFSFGQAHSHFSFCCFVSFRFVLFSFIFSRYIELVLYFKYTSSYHAHFDILYKCEQCKCVFAPAPMLCVFNAYIRSFGSIFENARVFFLLFFRRYNLASFYLDKEMTLKYCLIYNRS